MNSNEIDLHIHSYFSDGTMSPREILMEATQKMLKLISIMDHNVLEGCKELVQIVNGKIPEIISGVEIDTLDNGINYHALGY